jgi:hypothetical protein
MDRQLAACRAKMMMLPDSETSGFLGVAMMKQYLKNCMAAAGYKQTN